MIGEDSDDGDDPDPEESKEGSSKEGIAVTAQPIQVTESARACSY